MSIGQHISNQLGQQLNVYGVNLGTQTPAFRHALDVLDTNHSRFIEARELDVFIATRPAVSARLEAHLKEAEVLPPEPPYIKRLKSLGTVIAVAGLVMIFASPVVFALMALEMAWSLMIATSVAGACALVGGVFITDTVAYERKEEVNKAQERASEAIKAELSKAARDLAPADDPFRPADKDSEIRE
jgi:hypothetical protein